MEKKRSAELQTGLFRGSEKGAGGLYAGTDHPPRALGLRPSCLSLSRDLPTDLLSP